MSAGLSTLTALIALLVGRGEAGAGAPWAGEQGGGSSGGRVDAGTATVYLVTFGPGPRVFERFGHNGIWVRDTLTGDGPLYDFGRFSFEQERFLLRFARGEMMYWMGRDPGTATINRYIGMGRSVWLQELALSTEAKHQLMSSLDATFARDSGAYRYDYYRDNCSTRVRDALDAVVGGAIRATLDTAFTGATFRFHTRRSLDYSPGLYGLVMIGLGAGVDRPISQWDEAFLPMELRRYIRAVRVRGELGALLPLVRGEVAVAESDRFTVPEQPGRAPLRWYPVLGVVLGAGLASLGRLGGARPGARRGFLILAGAWELLAGVAALALVWLWGLSDHRAAHQNANVFQFNLLSLALLLALARLGAGRPAAWRASRVFAIAAAALAIAGPLVEWLAAWRQQNAEVIGLVLPLHLGVLLGVLSLTGATTPSPSGAPPSPR